MGNRGRCFPSVPNPYEATMTTNLEHWARTRGYDKSVDYSNKVSKNFNRAEFYCTGRCGVCSVNNEMHPPPAQLVQWLEMIRAHFNSPVIINSAYRCEKRNKEVGGSSNSQHLLGFATDIVVVDVTPLEVYTYCDQLIGDKGGVGKYDTFTHIDCRGHRARW